MSKRASATLIGGFVVGAVALGVASLAIFGSGRIFRNTREYVAYFDSDVNGLTIGAPVKFKGVEIGSVRDVLLNVNAMGISVTDTDGANYIPVIFELDQDRVRRKGSQVSLDDPGTLAQMIEGGLRAQLALESFVTGLLYVKLDLRPEAPLRLVRDPAVPYEEIPTIPTPLEEVQMRASQFFMKLEQTDIAGLVISLTRTAQGLDRLVSSPKFLSTFESLDTTLASLDATIASVKQLADELRLKVDPLTAGIAATSSTAEQTFVKAQAVLGQLDAMVGADSPLQYELRVSLEEVSTAARAVRLLAETIEQNPSILVRGRAAPSE